MAKNTDKAVKASVAASKAASTTEVKEVAVATPSTTVESEASKAYDINYVVSLIKSIRDINTSLKENEAYSDVPRISINVTFGKVSAKKATKTDAAVLGNFGYDISLRSNRGKDWYIVASVKGVSLDGIAVKVTMAKDGKCKLSKIETSRDYEEDSKALRNGVASDVFSYMKTKGLTSKDYDALIKDYATRLEARITWTNEEMAKATAKATAAESTAVSA